MTKEDFQKAVPEALEATAVPGLPVLRGKVRDIYDLGDRLLLVATDRLSAFDRVLGLVPYRGQILNSLSAWWFAATRDIIENHLIAVPDPNLSLVEKARPIPVEVVVRGYITGTTKTSLWELYRAGERRPYGVALPEGLRKNDPLPAPVITPTTKATGPGGRDERLTREAILKRGIVPRALWERIEDAALALFRRGQALAERAGFLLVDTKYEFGLVGDRLVLIDELHTPDSSRFWSVESYRRGAPEHFDKEFLRLWYAERGFTGEGTPPPLPDTLAAELAWRYARVFEGLTGRAFAPAPGPQRARVERVIREVAGG